MVSDKKGITLYYLMYRQIKITQVNHILLIKSN